MARRSTTIVIIAVACVAIVVWSLWSLLPRQGSPQVADVHPVGQERRADEEASPPTQDDGLDAALSDLDAVQ